MASTTAFNIHVSPQLLKEIYFNNVWHTQNVPLQWHSPERFGEFVKSLKTNGPEVLMTTRVDGYVSLDIGDEVCVYKTLFRVSARKYNADREDLVYDLVSFNEMKNREENIE